MAIKAKREGEMMDEEEEGEAKVRSRIREASRRRSKGHRRELSVEEVRGSKVINKLSKQWRRVPSINPYERTILLTGYPNVGKSSFINCVSKANVEVQPYPFTTKALYIGHTEHKHLRYQVIDSPGVLDHQL